MSDDPSASQRAAAGTDPPFLVVEQGRPTPSELAALVAVLAARRGSGTAQRHDVDRSAWSAPARLHRQIGQPGPAAWRASAHP